MDKVLAYTILLTIALSIMVCYMAVAMVFGGRFYYFTENSREERLVGAARRLSVDAPTTFEDGSVFEGVFIVPEGLQYRVTLPRGWTGDLETVELPKEVYKEVYEEPIKIDDVVRSYACYNLQDSGLLDKGHVNFDSKWVDVHGETVKLLRIEASTCAAGT